MFFLIHLTAKFFFAFSVISSFKDQFIINKISTPFILDGSLFMHSDENQHLHSRHWYQFHNIVIDMIDMRSSCLYQSVLFYGNQYI